MSAFLTTEAPDCLAQYRDELGRQIVVVSYSRLSSDPQGRKVTHGVQNDAMSALVERWQLPAVKPEHRFSDTDKSASDAAVVRRGYLAMLDLIRSLDARLYCVVVVAYKQDRLLRQPSETQDFGQLVGIDKAGRLITHAEGEVNLKRGGRQGFLLTGTLGYIETDATSLRVADHVGRNAAMGKAHGQQRYGWTRLYDTVGAGKPQAREIVNEAEATVIREAARDILSGRSIRSICDELNANQVPAPGANRVLERDEITRQPLRYSETLWSPQKLRQILVRKSNVAIRVHVSGSGEMKRTEEHAAVWPRILTDDVFIRLCAKLNDPARRTVVSNAVKYMLSGIATCECHGARVTVQKGHTGGKPADGSKRRASQPVYRTPKSCVAKSLEQTDEAVRRAVLTVLERPEIRAALGATPEEGTDALSEEAAILARQDEAGMMFAEGEITRAQLRVMNDRFNADLARLRARANAAVDATVYADLMSAEDIWTAWDEAYSIDRKRAVIRALFTVELRKSTRTGRGAFDPSTVVVKLREL